MVIIVFMVGNLPEFFHLTGLTEAYLTWWFAHNVLGLWITPVAAAIAYYTIPKVTGNPLVFAPHRAFALLVGRGVLLNARGASPDVRSAARMAEVLRLGGGCSDPGPGHCLRVQHPADDAGQVEHVRREPGDALHGHGRADGHSPEHAGRVSANSRDQLVHPRHRLDRGPRASGAARILDLPGSRRRLPRLADDPEAQAVLAQPRQYPLSGVC